jgi:hypothetical protein
VELRVWRGFLGREGGRGMGGKTYLGVLGEGESVKYLRIKS